MFYTTELLLTTVINPSVTEFFGGLITSAAGLLPLRSVDQSHHLSRKLEAQLQEQPRSATYQSS